MFARVLVGGHQILIQHFTQVRLQLRQTVAVGQGGSGALLQAQIVKFLCDRIRAAFHTTAGTGADILECRFDGGAGTQ
ncbi:hypothetical protein D3C86_2071290 [compost metagenome]